MNGTLLVNPALAGTIVAVFGAALLLIAYYYTRHDPREPPRARLSGIWARIPFVGHVVGIVSRRYEYMSDLSRACSAPIFTVQLPGKKLYVVTKPELIQQAQRNYQVLSFETLVIGLTSKLAGVSKRTRGIATKDVYGDGYYEDVHSIMSRSMQASNMGDMSHIAVTNIGTTWNTLGRDISALGGAKRIQLRIWLYYNMTTASARAVYGEHSPFEEPGFVKTFRQFADGMVPLMVSPYPKLTNPSSVAARETVVDAFKRYYASGHQNQASDLARGRHAAGIKHSVPLDDMARFEAIFGMSLLLNTPVATFWMLYHIFSDATLLAEVRAEVDACVSPMDMEGFKTISVDIVTQKCPLLSSVWHELLRYRAVNNSPREVTQDTNLGGYLLKKGSLLQLPSRPIHQDKRLWGDEALDFDARRFMPDREKKHKDSSFRAFGGGKTLCPGRHFAFREVMAAVAMTVARYELTPVGGEWEEPECWNTNVASALMMADKDIDLDVSVRKGQEGFQWKLVM